MEKGWTHATLLRAEELDEVWRITTEYGHLFPTKSEIAGRCTPRVGDRVSFYGDVPQGPGAVVDRLIIGECEVW